MGNNRFRIAPARILRIIDSETRARYQNQHELIRLRRTLANINTKQSDAMSRLAFNRHDVRTKLHQLQHENEQRELFKKLDELHQYNPIASINGSNFFYGSNVSSLESSSLLMHNLNASIEWEKSFIFPNTPYGMSNKRKPFKAFDNFQSQYSSRLDTSRNSFQQTESFLLSDRLTLKQHTERMKKSIRIAVAKSARDSNMAARRAAHNY